VGNRFNSPNVQVISNDLLYSNFVPLKTFLETKKIDGAGIRKKIDYLNNLNSLEDNYFSLNFGNRYFTLENARRIGEIRDEIEKISTTEEEKFILLTSLIYASDKIANTVGHYDAYRLKMDTTQELNLLIPEIDFEKNINNKIYQEDANALIRKISCDVLYIDPPYNSRQYSDTYHLLENLARWEKPDVFGKAKKMNRKNIKSKYSLRNAEVVFKDLIDNAKAKHILVSYNNTGESKHSRSNALIKDDEIIKILKGKGEVRVYERDYQAFTTGRSDSNGHTERVFYCKVA
jgi:adenine-specific DNA-methyltransferase